MLGRLLTHVGGFASAPAFQVGGQSVIDPSELFYDGNVVDSARALELGLANRVVPDDEFTSEVRAYAEQIAAGPPMGYTAVRRLIVESVDAIDRLTYLDREWAAQSALLRTDDAAEGFRSFVERRDPQFSGR